MGAQQIGEVVCYVEAGAVFLPSTIIGPPAGDTSTPLAFIYVAAGGWMVGCALDVSNGSIWVGSDTMVEPLASIRGPCILGRNNTVRSGSYLRESTVVGDSCILRGETKNA
jgi:hypothetical protein